MALTSKFGPRRLPQVPRPNARRLAAKVGGLSPHPPVTPAVDALLNQTFRKSSGLAATAKPFGNGILQQAQTGLKLPAKPPPINFSNAPPGSTAQETPPPPSQMGTWTAPTAGPPTSSTAQAPPPTPGLTDEQKRRLARLRRRKKAGKSYNELRLEKLKTLKAGEEWTGGPTKGLMKPEEETEEGGPAYSPEFESWWANREEMYFPGFSGGMDFDALKDLAWTLWEAGVAPQDIRNGLLNATGLGLIGGSWDQDLSAQSLAFIQALMQNPELAAQAVSWLAANSPGLTSAGAVGQWQSQAFAQFPELQQLWQSAAPAPAPAPGPGNPAPPGGGGAPAPAGAQPTMTGGVYDYGYGYGGWAPAPAAPTAPTPPQQTPGWYQDQQGGGPDALTRARRPRATSTPPSPYASAPAAVPQQAYQPNSSTGTAPPGASYMPTAAVAQPAGPWPGSMYSPNTAPFTAPPFPGASFTPAGDYFAGVPLTGEMEAGRRILEDQLAGTLSQLGYSWDQIGAIMNVLLARMNTEQGYARQAVNEDFAARGVYGSGGRLETRHLTDLDYQRQRQDLAFDAQNQYTDISNQASEAYQAYTQGLMELLLQIAAMQTANPGITVPMS